MDCKKGELMDGKAGGGGELLYSKVKESWGDLVVSVISKVK